MVLRLLVDRRAVGRGEGGHVVLRPLEGRLVVVREEEGRAEAPRLEQRGRHPAEVPAEEVP